MARSKILSLFDKLKLCERYVISNMVALKSFLKRTLSSSAKQIYINKIYNDLKSSNIKKSIYLALTLPRYDSSLIAQELGEKRFTIDIGPNNAIEFRFSHNIGKSLENAVFLELRRKDFELYHHKE